MANVDHSALVIYNCAEKGEMSTELFTCNFVVACSFFVFIMG